MSRVWEQAWEEPTVWDCAICLSTPAGRVHQCFEGHVFCAGCLAPEALPDRRCPTCRGALPDNPIRSLAAEQAIAALPASCQHCGQQLTRGTLAEHEGRCPQARVVCGATAEGCEWQGTRAELNSHAAGCLHLRCQGQIRSVRADAARYQEELRRKHVASQAEIAHLQEARQRVEARLAEVVEKLGRAESREATHAQRLVVARQAAEARVQDLLNDARRNGGQLPGGEHINLKVMTQDGNEIFFKCKQTTPLQKLMHAFCNREGVSMNSVRFLFDGKRINETQTPQQLDMEDGDVVDVMVEQKNVGEWTTSSDAQSCGDSLLLGAVRADGIDRTTALEIERTATGPAHAPAASHVSVEAVLTSAQCDALVAHADGMLGPRCAELDAKLFVTADSIAAVVGAEALAAIVQLGAAQLGEADRAACAAPSKVVLRRSAAEADGRSARRIAFHRDWCLAVVSVALSASHEGGRLLFAIDGRVHCPARPAGSAVAHNQPAAHGVSAITAGVRYNLILTFGDPLASAAA